MCMLMCVCTIKPKLTSVTSVTNNCTKKCDRLLKNDSNKTVAPTTVKQLKFHIGQKQ